MASQKARSSAPRGAARPRADESKGQLAPSRAKSHTEKPAADDPPSARTRRPAIADRNQRTQELAYYRAEKRGFAPGCELEDWLSAERELDVASSRYGS